MDELYRPPLWEGAVYVLAFLYYWLSYWLFGVAHVVSPEIMGC